MMKKEIDVQEWFQSHPGYNDIHKMILEELDKAKREGRPLKPFTSQYQLPAIADNSSGHKRS